MFYNYWLEIKYRIFFSIICWGFIAINCYYLKEILLYVFVEFTLKLNSYTLLYFLTTDVIEVFIFYLQLSYYVANQIAVMFFYYHIFVFFSTGLRLFEYIYFKRIAKILSISWLTFIYFLNNFIFPISWNFFLNFQNLANFENLIFFFEAKLNEFLSFYKSTFYAGNVVFQIVILFYIFLEFFKTNLLIIKKLKKQFYFLFFLCSTILTPPEVFFQLIISIFMVIIYELIIIYIIFKTELFNLSR